MVRSETVVIGSTSYTVHELKWRDLRDVLRAAVKVRVVGGEAGSVEFDLVGYIDALLRSCVRLADGSGIDVDSLSRSEVEQLAQKALELNPFPVIFGG
ncbi:MAG: hypothetical protein QXN23_05905 [Candidatus Caldarchaeum sp.]